MAQVINTNVSALFAGSALTKSANSLQTAQARLSSGLRINSAKDDATGLKIATNFDRDVRGAKMDLQNANNAISDAQTKDGYMAQISENTQRMREVFIQEQAQATPNFAANDEVVALLAENARLSAFTTQTTAIVVDNKGGTAGGQATADFTAAAAFADLDAFTTELDAVNTQRAQYGADMVSLGSAVSGLETAVVNLQASYSRIMDTDYAVETAQMARNNILQQAGTSMLAQANQTPQSVLSLLR